MPKIIFTSQYMRNASPAQLKNYVKNIGTREGVEKIDESKLLLPATVKQQQLIQQLIRDIPSTKDMLEYADYCGTPTIGNATEFISLALEQNLNLIGKRENYVDYIAGRPRVERIGEHGLYRCRRYGGAGAGAGGCVPPQRCCLDSCHQPAPGGCRKARIRQRQTVAGFAPQQESHALQANENRKREPPLVCRLSQ